MQMGDDYNKGGGSIHIRRLCPFAANGLGTKASVEGHFQAQPKGDNFVFES